MGSAAYRSGEKIKNEYDDRTHDYSKRSGVVYTEIMLPINAPREYQERGSLWNAVEQAEKSTRAQLSREVEIALPNEISEAEQIKLVREFVQTNFVSQGICADVAIHAKHSQKNENPHAHIMLTMRPINENGQWGAKSKKEYIFDAEGNKQYDPAKRSYKCRKIWATNWDSNEFLQGYRQKWADVLNATLEQKGIKVNFSPLTYEKQGIEQQPTIHLGHTAHVLEKRGVQTIRGNRNREIQHQNEKHKIIENPFAPIEESKESAMQYLAGLRDRYDEQRFFAYKEAKAYQGLQDAIKRSKIAIEAFKIDLANINALKKEKALEDQFGADLKGWQLLKQNSSHNRSLKLKDAIKEAGQEFTEKWEIAPQKAKETIKKRVQYIEKKTTESAKYTERIEQTKGIMQELKMQYQGGELYARLMYRIPNIAELLEELPPMKPLKHQTGESIKYALQRERDVAHELHFDDTTKPEAYARYTEEQVNFMNECMESAEREEQECREQRNMDRDDEWER